MTDHGRLVLPLQITEVRLKRGHRTPRRPVDGGQNEPAPAARPHNGPQRLQLTVLTGTRLGNLTVGQQLVGDNSHTAVTGLVRPIASMDVVAGYVDEAIRSAGSHPGLRQHDQVVSVPGQLLAVRAPSVSATVYSVQPSADPIAGRPAARHRPWSHADGGPTGGHGGFGDRPGEGTAGSA